ncbi:MAG: cytidine deaminase [Chitinophagia bacterium]|nr:cytidine deaminase [Chitinophagia bacterium]
MEQFSFAFQRSKISELPVAIQGLVEAARQAASEAYAPYSNFLVGAAVLFSNGIVKTGHNHENASYPAGVCAERSLLSTINPLLAHQQITAIAVIDGGRVLSADPLSPCGICRQTILEQQLAQQSPIAVYMCSSGGNVVFVEDATCLLPFYFSSKNLDV